MDIQALNSFLTLNGGEFIMVSNDGYYRVRNGQQEFGHLEGSFPGTVANILIMCDERHYVLKQEIGRQGQR